MLDRRQIALDLGRILALRDPASDLATAILEDRADRVLHCELRALEAVARRPGYEDLYAGRRVSFGERCRPTTY